MSKPPPEDVVIVPADPAWPAKFAAEKQRLLAAFSGRFLAIEHFGSTAVPGLSAKPVIDLLGGVESMDAADALLDPLCAMGWETSPEFNATLPDRRFLRRRNADEVRTHHLHLVVFEGDQWKRRLAFRDYLRGHPEVAREYETLKLGLAQAHRTDREAYTDAKGEFVERVLRRVLSQI